MSEQMATVPGGKALPAAPAGQGAGLRRAGARIMGSRIGPFIGVGTVLVALLLVEAITQGNFYGSANLTNLMRAMAVPLILGGAMTLALLTGGVDLSIGSSLGLSATVYAKLYEAGAPPILSLIACLAFGLVVGFAINGFLIGRLNMSFFVVTLGTLSLYRGVVYLWTNLKTIDMYEDKFTGGLGNDTILGGKVPVAFLIGVAVVVVLYLMLRFTTFGRQIYAVGGNKEAARLSGVRTDWVIAAVYAITGLCAAIAAVLMIGRTASVDPNIGESMELQAAAAVLLGGVALSGGNGSIWGAVLGVVFLGVLENALSLAGASASWQLIVTGLILVIAVYLDRVRARLHRQ
jgi:ribose/xylose/arabinose/galactoside ABC-type transport system permease subunit